VAVSDFKVGDKVKCIRADSYGKLTEGKTYTITSIVIGFTNTSGSSVCVDGIRDDWWYADRFELLHQPVEVHTGGPYVARSEYERVCVERDEGWAQAARIRDEAVKLAQARDKAIYDLNAVRATLEKRDAEVANLRHEQSVLLADLKDIEQTVIHLNKRVFADNPNGWPLVPVDPSCIPAGHRAVEVTCSTQNKWVTSYNNQARLFMSNDEYPRLVVEPIPTPQAPDTLPRPEFPAWIRAGWWVAMDAGGFWYMSEDEP